MIPEPPALKARPHYKGFPIPATATIKAGGIPDFAEINWPEMWKLGLRRRCALCGQEMSKRKKVAFLGGPVSAQNKVFSDGPMHPLCALYASVVCPYLAGKKTEHRADAIHDPLAITDYPDRIGLLLSLDYRMFEVKTARRVMYAIEEEPEIIWLDGDIQAIYQRVQSMGEVVP